MVTRDDVARLAGTSTAVVSYVLNNGPRPVAAATRRRVLQAVEELGYRPNAAARALSRRHDDVIGLIVPNFDNPYFAALGTAIEGAATAKGFTVILGNARHEDDRQAAYVETFLSRQCSGLILVGAAQESDGRNGPRTNALLKREQGVPLVSFDPLPNGARGTLLTPDNVPGAAAAVEHLLGHGHTRVGMLAGPQKFKAVQERERGWRETLENAEIDAASQTVVRCRFDRYEAFDLTERLLRSPRQFTALFIHTDEQAIGVIHAARAAGLTLPQDLAIVSFDGIREAGLITPQLTTVQQPITQLGARAVDLIQKQIARRPTNRTTERLTCELVTRTSCGCPG
ncbi:LacI family DNA-binding transcriptional regulator [Kribbella turkmenica]|uniref:LacI family DNA-binding transcriptional regulator n=1 Tax=Kribbella turkmenica TaxID=2530375 RepID=UPI00140468FC|nr:LacI family DNA-binding transcriptional regulator [Kribbella turkmenica]